MKQILLILTLLVISVTTLAHDPLYKHDPETWVPPSERKAWHKWLRPVAMIAWNAASVTLDATGDALYDKGKYLYDNNIDLDKGSNLIKWSHGLHAGQILMDLSGPFVFNLHGWDQWALWIGMYGTQRYASFDYTWNGVRGVPLTHIGGQSNYDQWMKNSKAAPGLIASSKVLSFGFTVGFTIHLNRKINEDHIHSY